MSIAAKTAVSVTPPPEGLPDSPQSRWLTGAVAFFATYAIWILLALMVLDGALLLYMGRGFSFFGDDWSFVTQDYGGGLHSLLKAHGGNISIFPIAAYKVLFRLAGLGHYVVYRLVVVGLHLLSGWLIFMIATRRSSRAVGLLAAAMIVFLGAAWEDLLWAFQMGYLLSVAGGLATWALLERNNRFGDLAATACLVIAVGSSSLGIALMVGVAVELAWRRQLRRVPVVLVPVVLYILWYLHYGESQITSNSLINAPGYAEDLAAAAFGGLVGRGLDWGRPLALAGLLVLFKRLAAPVAPSARLIGLLATGVTLWLIIAATRSTISPVESSRYIYLGAVVIVLAAAELVGEMQIGPRALALWAAVFVVSAITGLTVMHSNAISRRTNAITVTAELGALELAAAYASPGYEIDSLRAPTLKAGPYLHAVRAVGSTPADTPAQILASEPHGRTAADAMLMALEHPRLRPASRKSLASSATAPSLTGITAARQLRHAGCTEVTPIGASSVLSATVMMPRSGIAIEDLGQANVTLLLKRFGPSFMQIPNVLVAHSRTAISIPTDPSTLPWQLQLSSSSPLAICSLAG